MEKRNYIQPKTKTGKMRIHSILAGSSDITPEATVIGIGDGSADSSNGMMARSRLID